MKASQLAYSGDDAGITVVSSLFVALLLCSNFLFKFDSNWKHDRFRTELSRV